MKTTELTGTKFNKRLPRTPKNNNEGGIPCEAMRSCSYVLYAQSLRELNAAGKVELAKL